MSELAEHLWSGDAEGAARSRIHLHVHRLRTSLGDPGRIVRRGDGYALLIRPGELDVARFTELMDEARRDRKREDIWQARDRLTQALRLWRAEALADVEHTPLLRRYIAHLDDLRLAAQEEVISLSLALGEHASVTAHLRDLTQRHPWREQLVAHLMLALYRSGRQVEALAEYRAYHRRLVDDLGLQPGPQLRQLERAILEGDPALEKAGFGGQGEVVEAGERPATPRLAVPMMLPAAIIDFTGREHMLSQAGALLTERTSVTTMSVVAVSGPPGVGKTTTAVQLAHRLRHHFVDGQLYLNLHGAAADHVKPEEALARLLHALGVSGAAIPDGLDVRAEMYRGILADRRVLVVLDDAANEAQVLPLLPGSASCAVVMTSRHRLVGLSAAQMELDVFDPEHAEDLLTAILGTDRVAREADASQELAKMCGYLPLALRIAATKLAGNPHWTVTRFVERLRDERRRLDELTHSGLAVRASLGLSYQGLSLGARHLLRLLGTVEAPDFAGWVCAALLDASLAHADDVLDELVAARMVEVAATGQVGQLRYRLHDLIRIYARERAEDEESPTDRRVALQRVIGGYLALAERAHQQVFRGDYARVRGTAPRWAPQSGLVASLTLEPATWFEGERLSIVAAIRQASRMDLDEACWDLLVLCGSLFSSYNYLQDRQEAVRWALAVTLRTRNRRGYAAALVEQASVALVRNRYADAQGPLEQAAAIFREIVEPHGLAQAMDALGTVHRVGGRYQPALECYAEALDAVAAVQDPSTVSHILQSLSRTLIELGRLDEARDRIVAAAGITSANAPGSRTEAQVLTRLGELHVMLGETTAALGVLNRALATVRTFADLPGEAYVLANLGKAVLADGRHADAEPLLLRALRASEDVGASLIQGEILVTLAAVYQRMGLHQSAIVCCRSAQRLADRVGSPRLRTLATKAIADAQGPSGRLALTSHPHSDATCDGGGSQAFRSREQRGPTMWARSPAAAGTNRPNVGR